MDDNQNTTGPQRFSQINWRQSPADREASRALVTKLLTSLSQTFRFDSRVELVEKAYHFALDPLTPEQIRRAGEAAILRHKYKSMPQPAQLLEWATEIEESQGQAKPRTGLWRRVRVDEKGYEFYDRIEL